MKLDISDSFLDNLDHLQKSEKHLCVSSPYSRGLKSYNIFISLESEDEDGYCTFVLNRNTARYLRDVLNAFINEQDINPDDED